MSNIFDISDNLHALSAWNNTSDSIAVNTTSLIGSASSTNPEMLASWDRVEDHERDALNERIASLEAKIEAMQKQIDHLSKQWDD